MNCMPNELVVGSRQCARSLHAHALVRTQHSSRGVLMDEWLMVVVGWGIVGPTLAIGASYALA